MSAHPFDAALALTPDPVARHTFTGAIDPSWQQGRTTFGGLTAALMARAVSRVVDDERRVLRTAHLHFVAPAPPGLFVVEVAPIRAGALVSHLSATLSQGGAPVAFGTFTCAAPREGTLSYDALARAPDAAPFAQIDPVELGPPVAPVFTQHFEYRFAFGELPFSGAERAALGGYIRARPPRVLDAALAMAFLDAWPPAALARSDGLRAAASVDMRVEFFGSPLVDAETPGFVTCASGVAREGYADEEARLFVDGALVARCHQLVALLS